MAGPNNEELRQELNRLMTEQIESLRKQAFVTLSEVELRQQEDRLQRIREASAEYLAALKRRLLSNER